MLHFKSAHQLRSHLCLSLTHVLHSISEFERFNICIEHEEQRVALFAVVVLCHQVLSAAPATDRPKYVAMFMARRSEHTQAIVSQ